MQKKMKRMLHQPLLIPADQVTQMQLRKMRANGFKQGYGAHKNLKRYDRKRMKRQDLDQL